jgi:hypothetical protein
MQRDVESSNRENAAKEPTVKGRYADDPSPKTAADAVAACTCVAVSDLNGAYTIIACPRHAGSAWIKATDAP